MDTSKHTGNEISLQC